MRARIRSRFILTAITAISLLLVGEMRVTATPQGRPGSLTYRSGYRFPYPVRAISESIRQIELRAAAGARGAGGGEREPNPEELQWPINLPIDPPAQLAIGQSGNRAMGYGLWAMGPSTSGPSPITNSPSPITHQLPHVLASPPAELEFDTIADTGSVPPDDGMPPGPEHLVLVANSAIQIRMLDGTLVSTLALGSFFPEDPTGFIFDPRASFDAGAGRFIVTAVARMSTTPGLATCVFAVSATADATGVWHRYILDVGRGGTPPTSFADFPSLGFDGVAIYVTFNMFTFPPRSVFTGNRMVILDKAMALAGAPIVPIIVDDVLLPSPPFDDFALAGTLKPVEAVGPVNPGLMVTSAGFAGLALYKIASPLGIPAITSSFVDTTDFATAGSAPQSGSPALLHIGDARLQKTIFRDNVIWTGHHVSSTGIAGGKAQCVFYRVHPGEAGTLIDRDVMSDPSLSFFFPALVPDGLGNAIAVFQASDESTFPSIFHARYDSTTGSFEAPVLTEAGASPIIETDELGRNRFGDYTDASLDVETGRKIWIQGELAVDVSTWKLRAARVVSSPPGPPPDPGGRIRISPAALKFGTVRVGRSSTLQLPIRNVGREPLEGQVGPVSTPFSETMGGGTFNLAPRAHRRVSLRFAPALRARFEAVLEVSSDDPDHGLTPVPLKGIGR